MQSTAPHVTWQCPPCPTSRRNHGICSLASSAVCHGFEFFTANTCNKKTRVAAYRAVLGFFEWVKRRGIGLSEVQPTPVAAFVEERRLRASPPTVKQHLSAVRTLSDWARVGQIVAVSRVCSVRGPKCAGTASTIDTADGAQAEHAGKRVDAGGFGHGGRDDANPVAGLRDTHRDA